MTRQSKELMLISGAILLLLGEWLRPHSYRTYRRNYTNDTVITAQTEDQRRKRVEEDRRAEEARYKKHLLYVVARFNKKDSTSRRFIVLNTSRADIDSGRAIVFAHRWDGKSSAPKHTADTAEMMLRSIPSGRRDTLVVPQRGRSTTRYAIDSVALIGIVFR